MRKGILAGILGAAVALSSAAWMGGGAARAAAIAHWDFDKQMGDKGVFADSVGGGLGGHPGTPEDKSAITPYTGNDAPFGKAAEFNGSPGAYLNIPPLVIQKTSFTVAAWVKLNNAGPNFILTDWPDMAHAGFVFGTDPLGSPQAKIIVDLRGTTGVAARGRAPAPNADRVTVARRSISDIPMNDWHHVAWVWDRTDGKHASLTVYLDGQVIDGPRATRGTSSVDLDVNPGHTMRIGGREWLRADINEQRGFNGAMDELWVFNEALPQDKIKNLMERNNVEGQGLLAMNLRKKEQPAVAVAPTPATPKTDDTPTVQVVRPPAPPVPTVATNTPPSNSTPPAVTVTSTPDNQATVAAAPTTPKPANADGNAKPKDLFFDDDNSAADAQTPPDAHVAPVRPADNSEISPVTRNGSLGVMPRSDRSMRMTLAGVCAVLGVFFTGFVIWGTAERARLKAAGRL